MRNLIRRMAACRFGWRESGLVSLLAAGCSTPGLWVPTPGPAPPPRPVAAHHRPADPVRPASFQAPAAPDPRPAPAAEPDAAAPLGVDDLVRVAVERNPRIARATIAVDAAQGRYVQAGLYPNPVLAVVGDELGDRTGPGGIWTAPQVSQEVVTGRKLSLAQAVSGREVDQAALAVLAERFAVVGSVRAAFYETYALQKRLAILRELVHLAEQGVEQGRMLVANQRMARLDLIQLEVELQRFRAELAAVEGQLTDAARGEPHGERLPARKDVAVEGELRAAYARLAAVAGDPGLPIGLLAAPFDTLPDYDLEAALPVVLATHPEVRTARVGVDRARAAVARAEAEPIPNLTVSTGYTRQNQNRSNDWLLGVSAPIPVWNRNQGNVRAAKAELGMAVQDVGRAENQVAERVTAAFRAYNAARARAERYRREILPRAEETFKLSLEAFKGGQFEYLRVIQAQRAVAEARLELNRSLGEAWRAAGEISGLLLEEHWPGPPPPPPGPRAGPAVLPPPGKLPDPKP